MTNDLAMLLLSLEDHRQEELEKLKREAERLRVRLQAMEARHAEERAKWRDELKTQQAKARKLFDERQAAQKLAASSRVARDRMLALDAERTVIVRRLIVAVREGEDVDVETHTRALAAAFRLSYI